MSRATLIIYGGSARGAVTDPGSCAGDFEEVAATFVWPGAIRAWVFGRHWAQEVFFKTERAFDGYVEACLYAGLRVEVTDERDHQGVHLRGRADD